MSTITALNGRLPASSLAVADTGPNGPQRLRTDAAAAWERMLGAGMPAGHLRSGYRTLAQQQAEVERAKAGLTPSAAPVGTSQHGEGLAGDVDEPARTWVHTHGAAFGFVSGRVPREPWHVEYDRSTDQHAGDAGATTSTGDDDMPSIEEVRVAIADETAKVLRGNEFDLRIEQLSQRITAAVWSAQASKGGLGPGAMVDWVTDDRLAGAQILAQLAALTAAIQHAGTGGVVDTAALQAAATAGARAALDELAAAIKAE